MSVTLLALLMALTFVPCREAAVDVCEEIAAIKTQLEFSENLKYKVVDLERELPSVKSTLQKKAAFSVHYSDFQSSVDVQASEPFKFDVVVTNIGDGYNPNSGIFTAPYSGVYLFIVTITMDNEHSWLHAVIDKSGQILCRASLKEASYDRYDKSTCSSTTHMKAGDRVYVRRLIGDTYIRGGPYCSFTGALISADIN